MNKTLQQVKDSIDKAGNQIDNSFKNITDVINDVKQNLIVSSYSSVNDLDKNLKTYSPYRYYVGVALSCILLLVAVLIVLGLICGICGKRPDSYSDDCCNKGAGSRFLICGVGIMFFFGAILVLATLVYFVIGVPMYRIPCDSLKNPESSQVIKVVDKIMKKYLKESNLNVSISSILSDCHDDKSIYKVFKLQGVFDVQKIEHYIEEFNIDDKLEELKNNINYDFSKLDLLSNTANDNLEKLIQADISNVDFDKFYDELTQNFTSTSLDDFKIELDKVVNKLEEDPNLNDVTNELKEASLHVEVYQNYLLKPMKSNAQKLLNLTDSLKGSLIINGKSFEDILKNLQAEIEEAESFLKNKGQKQLQDIANEFASGIVNFVNSFLKRVSENVENNVGTCKPLSNVFNATLVSTCDRIIQPLVSLNIRWN